MEIERKFLIPKLPDDLESYAFHLIEQGYLCTDPVVRIRRQDDNYILTYKGKGLMCREEYNLPLNQEAYQHLKEKIDGNLISKKRYLIPIDHELTIELDVFHAPFETLRLAEVEFPSEDAANAFDTGSPPGSVPGEVLSLRLPVDPLIPTVLSYIPARSNRFQCEAKCPQ